MRHRHQRDVACFRRLKSGGDQLRGHVAEDVAAFERLRHLKQHAARVLLGGDPAAERRAEADHRRSPTFAPPWTADVVEDRLGKQLDQLSTVADVPVKRGGLDLETVGKAAHRERLQSLVVHERYGGLDEPFARQGAALSLFVRAQSG